MNDIQQPHLMPVGMDIDLKNHLARIGMKQADLVRATGLDKGYVSEIVNGKKTPSIATMRAIAAALKIELADLFGPITETSEATPSSGFSESDVSPYRFADKVIERSVLEGVAPRCRHPTTYRMRRTELSFGLLRGDVLIVDLHKSSRDGSLVIATITDSTGDASTLVRQYRAPWLMPGSSDDPAIRIDGEGTAAILGVVCGVFRSIDP